jgi:hypothetical protein
LFIENKLILNKYVCIFKHERDMIKYQLAKIYMHIKDAGVKKTERWFQHKGSQWVLTSAREAVLPVPSFEGAHGPVCHHDANYDRPLV